MSRLAPKIDRRPIRKNGQNNEGKSAPTSVLGPNVDQILLHKVPIFPIRTTRTGMLYYEQDIKLSHATSVKQDYFFSANGLYDPNVTGTGHQPMGFDQMMLFYEHYCVTKARAQVTFAGTDSDFPNMVGVYLSPDAVASTDHVKAVENGLLKMRLIDNEASAGGTGQRLAKFEIDVDVAKYFGRRSSQDLVDDVDCRGSATANPTEQVYFGVCAWGFPIGAPMQVYAAITISYDAVFLEPRKVASS